MSEVEKTINSLRISIALNKISEDEELKKGIIKKIVPLIEKLTDTYKFELIVEEDDLEIDLEFDSFSINIDFELKKPYISIWVLNPTKQIIEENNDFCNKIVTIFNTILGSNAENNIINSIRMISYEQKFEEFFKYLCNEEKLLRINEMAKNILEPNIVGFIYKNNDKEYNISLYSNEKSLIFLGSNFNNENIIPINILQKEYSDFDDPLNISNNIVKMMW